MIEYYNMFYYLPIYVSVLSYFISFCVASLAAVKSFESSGKMGTYCRIIVKAALQLLVKIT